MSLSLRDLGLGPRSHVAALWWLGLLYRRPVQFHATAHALGHRARLRAGLLLFLHALPWAALATWVGRSVLGALTGAGESAFDDLSVIGGWASIGVLLGFGVWALVDLGLGLATGLLGAVVLATLAGSDLTPTGARGFGGAILGTAVGLASRLSGDPPSRWLWLALGAFEGVVFSAAQGPLFGVAAAATAVVAHLRLYLLPLHALVVFADIRWPGRLYHLHPAAWDDVFHLPWPSLEAPLLALVERSPEAGRAELLRLRDSVPHRRAEAQRVLGIVTLRDAAREADLAQLPQRLRLLSAEACGGSAPLAQVRELVRRIARQQMVLNAAGPAVQRSRHARLLRTLIQDLLAYAAGLPLAAEFEAAGACWLARAQAQVTEAGAALHGDRWPKVFRAGNPIDRQSEAFVPRRDVLAELARQILAVGGSPGLLLYGRRRTGKSTVLRNLAGFLPPGAQLIELSMQDPQAFTSLEAFVSLLAERLAAACPAERPARLVSPDLAGLRDLLDKVDAALHPDRRVLVGLDEFEFLDHKIGTGAFSQDLLAALRSSIQTHRRVIWLFAGSLALEELPHAEWDSYLVGARTVVVPPFNLAETQLLLTDPLAHSPLWSPADPNRPRFDTAFWGEGTLARIHDEAGGWPHLVQLVAEIAVDLVNDREDERVTPPLLERALDSAVELGDAVLRLLLEKECRFPGEWEYVARFRTREEQPPPDDDGVRRSLRRRLLVVEDGGLWRLRVPLMRRWLLRNG